MDHRVAAAINIMHRKLADRVSILRLSRSVNLSSSRLRQLFREDTGRSPMQYLRDLRMQNAESLLRNTFLSIKEVAFVSGTGDASSFVREFKRRYCVTPSKFRSRG
jgi:transcriptional regulator GlxA family with amidase domain